MMCVFQLLYPLYFEVVYKEIGHYYIKDDAFLTYIGSASFIAFSIWKLIGGIMLDFVSIKKVNTVVLIIMILHVLTIQYTV